MARRTHDDSSAMRWYFTLTVTLIVVVGTRLESNAARVALMNFICEDNSYRSTVAAADFTTLLQAGLSDAADVEWVERAELDRVEAEMHLTGLGLIDRVEAIRSGRWVKADWGIFGRISTNGPNGRIVLLEVVDLQRADVLAAIDLRLIPRVESHFSVQSGDFPSVEKALRALLQQAHVEYAGHAGRKSVALLFTTRTGSRTDLDSLEESFQAELERELARGGSLHLVQFQRAGAAMDEANLVLSGLAVSEPGAWERVADLYFWGEFNVSNQRFFDREAQRWRHSTRVDLKVSLLGGTDGVIEVNVTVTNATSTESAASELATSVANTLVTTRNGKLGDAVRAKAAAALTTHTIQLAESFPTHGVATPGGFRQWLDTVQTLEAACFLDPGNQTARELWTRVRWRSRAAKASRNEFFFARRRSDAWRRYVEQFGFESSCPAPRFGWWDTNSVAAEYVLSAWRPYEMFKFSQYNQARWGVPRDAGARELSGWQKSFAADYYSRLLTAPHDSEYLANLHEILPYAFAMDGDEFVLGDALMRQRILDRLWPHMLEAQRVDPGEFDSAYRHGFRMHFKELGQAGRDEEYLAQLDEIGRAHREKIRARPIQLPRASILDESKSESR